MRLALVIGAVLVASTAGSAAPRPGKVVRVERRARSVLGTPRVCTIDPTGTGFCIGKAPAIGDRLDVIDLVHPLGVYRVTAANPLPDACNQSAVWQIQGKLENGDLSSVQGQIIGVIDVPLDALRGHLVNVDHSPSGTPLAPDQIQAIDEDGDGKPDVEFLNFPCDDAGYPTSSPTGNCFDVWANTTHGFERVRQDRLRTCL